MQRNPVEVSIPKRCPWSLQAFFFFFATVKAKQSKWFCLKVNSMHGWTGLSSGRANQQTFPREKLLQVPVLTDTWFVASEVSGERLASTSVLSPFWDYGFCLLLSLETHHPILLLTFLIPPVGFLCPSSLCGSLQGRGDQSICSVYSLTWKSSACWLVG